MILRRITRSLSARLLAVFLVTSLIYFFAGRWAVEMLRHTDYLREIAGAHIALHADLVLKEIGVPPDPAKAQAIVDRIPMDIQIIGGGINWASDPSFPSVDKLQLAPIQFLQLDEKSQKDLESWARTLERVRFGNYKRHFFAELKYRGYTIIFASPKVSEAAPPDFTGLAIVLTSILVLTGLFFTVSWLIRPIRWIQEGAERIGHGDLDFRIRTSRRDDLGQLAEDINHMAGDVRGMLEAKQQLLLAISHELRSPITRAKVALEFLDDGRVKQDVLDDLREMERLIGDLLESERMNTGHTTLHRSSLEVRNLLESLVANEFADRSSRIALHLPPTTVTREVDGVRVRLMMRNLIENALRYAPPDGPPVEVALAVRPGDIVLSVRDRGAGISREHLTRVTEPFYRADPARSRSTGGLGLGLYLARRIAEAHRGTLVIDSEPGHGTTVTVTLPDLAIVPRED